MIDFFASAPWYVDHLAPIWLALPPAQRGRFYVSHKASAAVLEGAHIGRPTMDPHPIVVASFGDYRVATMCGRSSIALGQHGAGQSYSSDGTAYPGGRGQGQVALFLVPNETAARRTRERYKRTRVEIVGCPKLETLPRKERSGDPVVALSFHWDGPNIAPEMKSAWSFYRSILPALGKRFHVLGHAHPRSVEMLRSWYYRTGIEVVPSFAEILRRADVYAVDNSSSLFEFAATGRPVVVLNTPDYRRNVEHGLRFWAASGVGVNCERPGDLPGSFARAIEDPPEVAAAREAALDIVYQPRTGSAELAAAVLVDWAVTRRPVHDPFARRKTQIQAFRSVRAERPVAR